MPSTPVIGSRSGTKAFEMAPDLVLSLTMPQRGVEYAIFHKITHESFDIPVIEEVILRGNEANYGRAILRG
jgi:hypothetical protein